MAWGSFAGFREGVSSGDVLPGQAHRGPGHVHSPWLLDEAGRVGESE